VPGKNGFYYAKSTVEIQGSIRNVVKRPRLASEEKKVRSEHSLSEIVIYTPLNKNEKFELHGSFAPDRSGILESYISNAAVGVAKLVSIVVMVPHLYNEMVGYLRQRAEADADRLARLFLDMANENDWDIVPRARIQGHVERLNAGKHAFPMPTKEELEREHKLYSQARAVAEGERDALPAAIAAAIATAETEGRRYTIIDHLRAVWMPWIEAGELTRPALLHSDQSAYKALAVWCGKPSNDLKVALGREIPSKSDLINSIAAQIDEVGKRPAHVSWVLRDRARRSRARARQSAKAELE
jgi:hypothetical protein